MEILLRKVIGMTKIIEFIILTVTASSLLFLLTFIFFVLSEIAEWMRDNKIIRKRLNKAFKTGKKVGEEE